METDLGGEHPAPQAIAAGGAGGAVLKAVGASLAAIGQDRNVGGGEKFKLLDDAVAAGVAAGAAGIATDRVAPDAEGVEALEGLQWGVEAVGHVRVGSAEAWRVGTRAHAAGYGFIVGEGPAGAGIEAAEG